jgi:hypothetical protein
MMDTVAEVNHQTYSGCSIPRSVANFSVFFRPARARTVAGAGAPGWPGLLEYSSSEQQRIIEKTLLLSLQKTETKQNCSNKRELWLLILRKFCSFIGVNLIIQIARFQINSLCSSLRYFIIHYLVE